MHISLSLINSQILSSNPTLDPLKNFLKISYPTHVQAVLISDSQVFPLYGEQILQLFRECGLRIEAIILPSGEQSKNLSSAELCWTRMHALGMDRTSLVIGLGGGVITDLTGFVASCYMRGIDHILIPTTLMGMVDAAIGGKTGVNLPQGKNLIGTFCQPKLVLIAPHFLDSLPQRELHSGLAEIIKSAVISDEQFFEYLEKNLKSIVEAGPHQMEYLIEKTGAIKAEIVQKDEKERGLRMILNWGHTFAHALETITHYQTFLHGEAVSIGMCCAALVSQELGLVEHDFVERQKKLCESANLPTQIPNSIDVDELIRIMLGDKKNISGKINLIVARKIGQVEKFNDVDQKIIKKILLKLKNIR